MKTGFLISKYSGVLPYVPGEQPRDRRYIKLNTNESPYPPSGAVLRAVSEEAGSLNLYPDPTCTELRCAVANKLGLDKENILPTNGSDEVLSLSFMAYAGGERSAYYPDVTYGFYGVLCNLYGIEKRIVPLKSNFSLDRRDYCGLSEGLIAIANPNAPTGLYISVGEIETICRSSPDCIVLIDEAYIDFGSESCYRLVRELPNLIVSRTYSKSMSLAGARLGFAIASKERIKELETLKFALNPYSVGKTALSAGLAAVSDMDYYMENCRKIAETRDKTQIVLKNFGFKTTESAANFIFCRHEKLSGKRIYERLKEKVILVRRFDSERIRNYLRISVGTPSDMQALTSALEEILSEERL